MLGGKKRRLPRSLCDSNGDLRGIIRFLGEFKACSYIIQGARAAISIVYRSFVYVSSQTSQKRC